DLTLDGLDNPVLTGTTFSADFPTTSGAYDTSPNGEEDAFVAKLSSSGTTLLWSTFLGGGSQENFSAIDLTTSGEIVVAGETSSSDFPTTAGAYDPYSWGRAIFVSKLSASGSTLVWSTFIEGSGSDDIPDVAVAPSGDVVVVGETESTDFPVTPGAFDSSYNGGRDFFVSRLSSSGSDLLWSSFLGGAGGEVEPALALRPSGQAIILGSSSSADFPTTSGAFDPTHNGGSYDAAVAEIRIGRRLLVNPDGSGDWPNIQAAIDSSLGGDVIELADGIYTGPGNRDLDYRGKAITVRSQSGDPERCVLWCRAHAGDVHRALLFHSGEGPESRLEGIGILEGYMWDGGAIACSEVPCSPSITNCILINNYSSDDGGGIHCSEGSSPTLTDCVITGNRANDKGGGVHIVSGSPTFLRCTITDNQAIVSNGGGVYMQQDCAPTLTDCVISGNSAGDKAGGVYCRDSSPATLLRCTITDNLAPGWGGGLLCYNLSDPTVTGCTFSGNSGSDAGGISATLNSFVTVENTIIAFSAGGAAVYCDGTGAVDLACCDLYGNAGGDYVGCVADEFEVDGNLRDDPMFCDAGGADFHLRSCSPCLSAEGCGLIGALDRG
ncbi:MAG: right-handed parallel beta-helix repeat-containing protein, partial [Gemmatimonadetes bacterium]|nr:right-handed parallel beta-helix repeat-containing protein [Gemmatimonadota bacterium]